MKPPLQNNQELSDFEGRKREAVRWAPEFEEAMKFNMDGGQREAHAERMKAEAEQIRANARKTNAEARVLEQSNSKTRMMIALQYFMIGLAIFAAGFFAGLLLQRHVGILPW